MAQRVRLMELCKDDRQSRIEFIKILNKGLAQESEVDRTKLALMSWELGFWECHNIFYQAVKRGDIVIAVEIDGELRKFLPMPVE